MSFSTVSQVFKLIHVRGHGDLVAINSFTGEIYLNQMADNITCNIRLGVEVSNGRWFFHIRRSSCACERSSSHVGF